MVNISPAHNREGSDSSISVSQWDKAVLLNLKGRERNSLPLRA